VLEGTSYAFRDLFSLLDGANVPVSEIRAIGGGVKSPLWRQILADVLNRPLKQVNAEEGPAYGAALLAAVGTGAYDTVPEACRATIRTTAESAPDPGTAAVYDRYYPTYRALYPALKEQFTALSRLSQ